MNRQKTNYLFLLIVTIIGSAITIYILYRIPDQTEVWARPMPSVSLVKNNTANVTFTSLVNQGWKVYRNESMNVELAYPGDWIVKKDGEHEVLILPSKFENNSVLADLNFYVEYLENSNNENLPFNEWIAKNIDSRNTITSKTINIGNFNALYTISIPTKSETLYGDNNYFNHVFINILKNNSEYDISGRKLPISSNGELATTDITAAKQYETQFEQILASFHFLH